MEGALSRKLGSVLGNVGFSLTNRFGGLRKSLCATLDPTLRCPRQCRYIMCHALRLFAMSILNDLFTMLSIMTDTHCLFRAMYSTMLSTISRCRSRHTMLFFLGGTIQMVLPRFLLPAAPGPSLEDATGPPGMYPRFRFATAKLVFVEAALDLEVVSAVLIGLSKKHALSMAGTGVPFKWNSFLG